MSAWVVTEKHINAIVNWYNTNNESVRIDPLDPEKLGQTLWNENHRSVNYRYDETFEYPVFTFRPLFDKQLEPVQVLKALACLEYQSCECPDYQDTPAYKRLLAIRAAAIADLPGYEEFPWGID